MTPRELEPLMTPITLCDLWNAFLLDWEGLGVPVLRKAVTLKLAHVMAEVGSKLDCAHQFNIGNKKSFPGDGCHWQYFACGEEVPALNVPWVDGLAPGLVDIKARYVKQGANWCSIWIRLPEAGAKRHPWTKFAAFESLRDGVRSQFRYLLKRPAVLAALQTGDLQCYNHALAKAAYYTADETVYLTLLSRRLQLVQRELAMYDWGDVP